MADTKKYKILKYRFNDNDEWRKPCNQDILTTQSEDNMIVRTGEFRPNNIFGEPIIGGYRMHSRDMICFNTGKIYATFENGEVVEFDGDTDSFEIETTATESKQFDHKKSFSFKCGNVKFEKYGKMMLFNGWSREQCRLYCKMKATKNNRSKKRLWNRIIKEAK